MALPISHIGDLKSIDLEEAEKIAGHILETMKQTVEQFRRSDHFGCCH